jgi:hypothetical protein
MLVVGAQRLFPFNTQPLRPSLSCDALHTVRGTIIPDTLQVALGSGRRPMSADSVATRSDCQNWSVPQARR